MDTQYQGIILLSNNRQRKTALLDKSIGFFNASTKQELFAGSIISYCRNPFVGGYFLSNITIEYMPLSLAVHDILFLHHILELCYYFIPEGSCVEGVFDVITWIYSFIDKPLPSYVKKYAIIKLLITIGLWPENAEMYSTYIHQLIEMPIDKITIQSIHLANERELDKWLRFCILQHPCSGKLQTIMFLFQGIQE